MGGEAVWSEQGLSFLVTVLVMEVTPGPNMAWLALLSATAGRGAGLAAVAGIALGLAVQGVVAAYGVAAVLEAAPGAARALHLAGVAFLLWLAWESWRDAGRPTHHLPGGGEGAAAGFWRGLVTNLLNPKAAVFFVAVLPVFVAEAPGGAGTAGLTAIYLAVATGVHLTIVALAGAARGWLADPTVSVQMHRVQAVVLCAVAVWMLLRG